MNDELKDVDKGIAFILELVLGVFGILGVGYIYAGETTNGVLRLVIWMFVLMTFWFIIMILMAFFIGLCFVPAMFALQLCVPVLSAFMLRSKLEDRFPE